MLFSAYTQQVSQRAGERGTWWETLSSAPGTEVSLRQSQWPAGVPFPAQVSREEPAVPGSRWPSQRAVLGKPGKPRRREEPLSSRFWLSLPALLDLILCLDVNTSAKWVLNAGVSVCKRALASTWEVQMILQGAGHWKIRFPQAPAGWGNSN